MYTDSKRRRNTFPLPVVPAMTGIEIKTRLAALLSSTRREVYLLDELLSKYADPSPESKSFRRSQAIFKWLCSEQNNSATNERLLSTHEDFRILPHVKFSRFVEKIQSIIENVIGTLPPVDSFIGAFTGGASTSRSRTESHPASKYIGQADVTIDALPYWELAFSEMPGWESISQPSLRVVLGNELFTVPKNDVIDRCACKEPDINMFLQKGLGIYIDKSLRRVGINLHDQSVNQRLARQGSIDGSLATIDLSAASDSITRELVAMLLPVNWYTALDSVRSKVTTIDGEEHVNEMFSSMGNGFTFPLQSLIFYSICRATAYFEGISGVISVYGDDIIIPVALTDMLVFVLSYFGFQVNTKKSYWTGDFRESCGGHYINGLDVTPLYLKGPITNLSDVIHFANRIRFWSSESSDICDPRLFGLWSELAKLVPKSLWGGRDLTSKLQLASPGVARNILSPVLRKKSTDDGGLIMWLNATYDRNRSPDSSGVFSTRTLETGKYRFRRANRTVFGVIPIFPQEVGVTTDTLP